MSKDVKEKKPAKVLMLIKKDAAFGFVEIELDAELIKKHGKITDGCEPDIFSIFMNNITKKARQLFDI